MTPTLITSRENTAAVSGAPKSAEKTAAHAAHNHDPFIFLVEPEPSSNLSRHAASQLKSGALPPGGAAQQVGEDRADKNQRRCLNRNRFCGADRPNHQICSLIPLHFRNFIKKHDQQAAPRAETRLGKDTGRCNGWLRPHSSETECRRPPAPSPSAGRKPPILGNHSMLQPMLQLFPNRLLHGSHSPFRRVSGTAGKPDAFPLL